MSTTTIRRWEAASARAQVIAGYDFADGTADPMATASQHGTSIAGLIGSSDPNDLGVAPAANIVALRVTDNSNAASLQNVANALQWVITNHSRTTSQR